MYLRFDKETNLMTVDKTMVSRGIKREKVLVKVQDQHGASSEFNVIFNFYKDNEVSADQVVFEEERESLPLKAYIKSID